MPISKSKKRRNQRKRAAKRTNWSWLGWGVVIGGVVYAAAKFAANKIASKYSFGRPRFLSASTTWLTSNIEIGFPIISQFDADATVKSFKGTIQYEGKPVADVVSTNSPTIPANGQANIELETTSKNTVLLSSVLTDISDGTLDADFLLIGTAIVGNEQLGFVNIPVNDFLPIPSI